MRLQALGKPWRYTASPTRLSVSLGVGKALLSQVSAQCMAGAGAVIPGTLDVRDTAAMQAYTGQFLAQAAGIDLVMPALAVVRQIT